MDDPSLYPDEYHSGAVRILPRRRTFNRGQAAIELVDATVDWTQLQLASFLGAPAVSAELELAHLRMVRAHAVLEWEAQRDAAQATMFPGPLYDDETVAELLAGVCG